MGGDDKVSKSRNIALKGFTLLELILVLIVLSVIAVLAIPNFHQTFFQLQLKQTAQHLSYLMRYAQNRAITLGQDHHLEFGPEHTQYWLTSYQEPADENSDEKAGFKRIPSRLGRTFVIPPEIRLESPQPFILFKDNGDIDKVRLYLCAQSRCFTISTQEQSGYVQVFDERVENK